MPINILPCRKQSNTETSGPNVNAVRPRSPRLEGRDVVGRVLHSLEGDRHAGIIRQ